MKRSLALLLLLPSLLRAQPGNPDSLLRRLQASLAQHQSVSYASQMRFKFFSGRDTLRDQGRVMLYRLPEDTLFHGLIRLEHDSTLILYDGTFIYIANTERRTATRYRALEEDWALRSEISERMIWDGFLNPKVYDAFFEAGTVLRQGADSLVGGRRCYAFHFRLPDEEPFVDYRRHLFLSADSLLPLLSWGCVRFQGDEQFDETLQPGYRFDRLRPRDFSARKLLRGYEIEDYVSPTLEDYRLLDSGSVAPPLAGLRYGDSLRPDTVLFAGKWTLLDFWYSTCYPCIQALPALERIHEAFASERFQVLGVNHADSDSAGLARLPGFLAHNPIRYPILLVEQQVLRDYKIKVWPSFYLISPEGRVHQTFLGYGGSRGEDFYQLMEKLLSQP
jgi:thiol-disulfide isomerase/thioredoxin